MKKKIFPIEEIKVLVENGYTIQEMAQHFGASRTTLGKFLRENNIKSRAAANKEKYAKFNSEEIGKKYLQGKTIKELSKEYECSTSTIKSRILSQKIKLRDNSESHQKYSINVDYFEKIDTMDKAYLLGFFCADGWVTDTHAFGIALKADDIKMIEFFQKELNSNKPIVFKDGGKYAELRLQNKKVAGDLEKYGITPRKSLVLDIKKVIESANLNEKQIRAFLLGYFDGDGGFSKTKPTEKYPTIQYSANITGTYETCEYYKNYFGQVGFFTKRHKDEKNNYTYRIGGRNVVRNAFQSLYAIKDEISFFYERKYKIFIEM